VYVSPRRDGGAARCFFAQALATTKVAPVEVTTDKAAVYPHVFDALIRQPHLVMFEALSLVVASFGACLVGSSPV
jgi:transposase-like protein